MNLFCRLLLVVAGLMGAAGVAAAAAAAHVGGGDTLVTAAHFLLFDAAAIAGLVAVALQLGRGRAMLAAAAGLIAIGGLLFSGDLATRALMEVKLLGGSAPFGGSLMILGWLLAAAAALFARKA
ncbi:DUF423 domain-containing protein [Xanthobacter sp. KR7-225]|uniref:DUF423 domain-containing protein n=1 Tax=Xanthobacter sp. KR7-225 TaxID=3156613 RepID=UPI0032B43446